MKDDSLFSMFRMGFYKDRSEQDLHSSDSLIILFCKLLLEHELIYLNRDMMDMVIKVGISLSKADRIMHKKMIMLNNALW